MKKIYSGYFWNKLIKCSFYDFFKKQLHVSKVHFALFLWIGGTQLLPRIVGVARAKELIFTSRVLDGVQAEKMGVVNHVVEQNKEGTSAYERALTLAEEIIPQVCAVMCFSATYYFVKLHGS